MTDHKLMQEPNLWVPMIHDPVGLAILGKWQEELGELQSATARVIIQGIDEAHPVTGKVNRDWLQDEMADVEAMQTIGFHYFSLYQNVDRTRAKTKQKREWLNMIRKHLKL